jgi:PGF-CTERM protein
MPIRPDGSGRRRLSRRAFLAAGAAVVSLGGVRADVSSQPVTRPAVIQQPDRFAGQNLAGFTIRVTDGQSYPATSVAVDCEFDGWPPGSVTSHDAHLVDRKQADSPARETVLYVDGDISIATGQTYLVNTFQQCGTDYVGVELEGIDQGTGAPVVEIEDDERPNANTGTAAETPGFGVVAALAGVAGLAGLLARRESEEWC